jgi:hypothetical protein
MDNPSSNPTFEARHLASVSGWYVRVAWSNGKRDHIPGFVSQREAQRLKKKPRRGCRRKAPESLWPSRNRIGAPMPGGGQKRTKVQAT